MKKEKDFSEKMGSSKKKALESLSDDEMQDVLKQFAGKCEIKPK